MFILTVASYICIFLVAFFSGYFLCKFRINKILAERIGLTEDHREKYEKLKRDLESTTILRERVDDLVYLYGTTAVKNSADKLNCGVLTATFGKDYNLCKFYPKELR